MNGPFPRCEVYRSFLFFYNVQLIDFTEGQMVALTDNPWPSWGRRRTGKRANALLRDYVAHKRGGAL